ncbi:MAG: 5-formyltetrahydrofolate cyclo-ligase [Bacteroidota bacterium]
MTKAEFRTAALEARTQMAPAEYLERSRLLTEQFFSATDLSFNGTVQTFLPMTERREPDLWPLIDRIRREFPQVTIVVPRMQGETLQHFRFEGLHQLKENKYGILEPTGGTELPVARFDLVLVPLLVADLAGNRIGYGKGYYDRFLGQCRPDCIRMGVSLTDPVRELPAEPHDVPLTRLLTPGGILSFG